MAEEEDRALVLTAVRFPPSALDRLKAVAGRLDRSVSWCIRAAVDDWLNRQSPK